MSDSHFPEFKKDYEEMWTLVREGIRASEEGNEDFAWYAVGKFMDDIERSYTQEANKNLMKAVEALGKDKP